MLYFSQVETPVFVLYIANNKTGPIYEPFELRHEAGFHRFNKEMSSSANEETNEWNERYDIFERFQAFHAGHHTSNTHQARDNQDQVLNKQTHSCHLPLEPCEHHPYRQEN